ncbi:nitroreductase family protein [Christensenellaceae bacterium OttesenSCG-928-K19]|nr:nitroreductase family protein [Christensenellaceae bacterium OttesenSCG-928-K19]
MELFEAMKARHSVRAYTGKEIEENTQDELRHVIDECNRRSGLHIQLCTGEQNAFSGFAARYHGFRNVGNYIALVGARDGSMDEKCGYYGEKIVLKAQQLGLNTCWVSMAQVRHSVTQGVVSQKVSIHPGEKLLMVIAVGYGETDGFSHAVTPVEALCRLDGAMPEWFRTGVRAAQLAPFYGNRQRFHFQLYGNMVRALAGPGRYAKVELGIAKYHFESVAGQIGWQWEKSDPPVRKPNMGMMHPT